jgi:MFS family permease
VNHPDRRRAFRLLFAALFVMGASNSMLFVILPMVTRAMGTGEIYVGLIFAGSSLFYMGFSPFWGNLSDSKGRRPILLVGLAGNTLSLTAIALVAGSALSGALAPMVAMALFAFSRMLYGSIGSAIQPSAQAYIADRTGVHERTRLMSALTAGSGLGTAFGPPLAAWAGGLISVEGFVLALAGVSFAVFIMIALALPEHRAPTPRKPGSQHLWRLARDHRLWPYLIVGVAGWTAQGVFLQTLLFYLLDKAHLAIEQAALVSGTILAGGAFLVFGAQFILIPVLRLRPRILMIVGMILTGTGALTMMLGSDVWSIGFAFLLTSMGTGLSRPGVVSGASLSVEPVEQGGAAGLATATAGAGFFLAPFIGLALYQFVRPEAAYGAVATLVLLTAVLAITNRRIRLVG